MTRIGSLPDTHRAQLLNFDRMENNWIRLYSQIGSMVRENKRVSLHFIPTNVNVYLILL